MGAVAESGIGSKGEDAMSSTEATDQVWTEEDIKALGQKTAKFADSLTPRERAAFAAILQTTAERTPQEDVEGYNIGGPGVAFVPAFQQMAFDRAVADAIKYVQGALKKSQQQK